MDATYKVLHIYSRFLLYLGLNYEFVRKKLELQLTFIYELVGRLTVKHGGIRKSKECT